MFFLYAQYFENKEQIYFESLMSYSPASYWKVDTFWILFTFDEAIMFFLATVSFQYQT